MKENMTDSEYIEKQKLLFENVQELSTSKSSPEYQSATTGLRVLELLLELLEKNPDISLILIH